MLTFFKSALTVLAYTLGGMYVGALSTIGQPTGLYPVVAKNFALYTVVTALGLVVCIAGYRALNRHCSCHRP
ncbi:MAG: hypothetical protein PHG73_01220 [Pygmaiobacter sp.]|nr:hypothetical protein [Pygmaiobacter sp.]